MENNKDQKEVKKEVQETKKKGLSKGLLGMKFMQRQQEADLRKKLEEDQRKKISESHWVVEGLSEDSFPTVNHMNESTFDFELGRRSFNSFNPKIEKLEETTYGEDTEEFKPPKKVAKIYNKDDDAEISSLDMSEKLTSFKRKREEMDPPSYSRSKLPEDNPDISFYNRNRKSKKALKYRK